MFEDDDNTLLSSKKPSLFVNYALFVNARDER